MLLSNKAKKLVLLISVCIRISWFFFFPKNANNKFKNLVPAYSKRTSHCGNIWMHVNSRAVNSEFKTWKYCCPEELQAQNVFGLNLSAVSYRCISVETNSTVLLTQHRPLLSSDTIFIYIKFSISVSFSPPLFPEICECRPGCKYNTDCKTLKYHFFAYLTVKLILKSVTFESAVRFVNLFNLFLGFSPSLRLL